MHKLNLLVVMMLLSLTIVACGPSQAELDAAATQVVQDYYATLTAAPTATPTPTPTPTATPTPTSTPTPIPGKFINPPEFLEIVYYPDLMWMAKPNNLRVGYKLSLDLDYLPYYSYAGDRAIQVGCGFLKEVPDENQVFIELVSTVLPNYVSSAAQTQIAQFIEENEALGTYRKTIDKFSVILEIMMVKDSRTMVLTIWEM